VSQTGPILVTKSDVEAAYDEWQLYLYDAEVSKWAVEDSNLQPWD
jgi:hypothetical protein